MVLSKHQFDKSFPPQYTHRYTGLLPRCHQQHGGIFYIVVLCSSVGRLQAGTRLSDGRGVIIRPTGNQANRERPLMSRSLPVDGRPSVCLSRLVVPRQDRRSTRSRSATERERQGEEVAVCRRSRLPRKELLDVFYACHSTAQCPVFTRIVISVET